MQIPVEKKYQQKDFFRSLFRPRGTHFEPFAWARRSVRNPKDKRLRERRGVCLELQPVPDY
jgi:hypothetical protein